LTTPSVPTVSTAAATCSAAGTASITNYSGALTYTFTQAGPSTGAGGAITGMTAGTSYTVTAGNGSCTSLASSSFSIATQLTTPSVPTVSTVAATCSAAGTASITNYDGALTYTFTPAGPSAGAGGAITGMTAGTSYTVTAGNGSCTSVASSSFSIAVPLCGPTANNNSITTNEDVPVTLPSIQSNDTDSDGNVVTSTIDLDPTTAGQQTTLTTANGTWSLNTITGDVTFSPSSNFNGTASINYTIQDNSGLASNSASLTVIVTPVNDAPNAVDDNASTNEDTAVLIDVTSNDTDTDGAINDASVTIVTNPTNGTVTVNPTTGEVTYTPNAGFNGTDSFTYSVCDNGTPLPAQCDQATVTVTVNAVNDPPVVDNDSNTIAEDGGSATGDLTDTGDIDPDGTTLTVNTTPVDGPNNGTISINSDGTYSYTPNAGFNGQDTIVVSVCDNGTPLPAICVNDTLIITVTPINDAPNAVDDVASTNEDTPVVIDVTNNDTDTDGSINDASVTIVTNPTNGTVTVNPTTGEVTYTPNAGFNGTDFFTYSVCDNGTPLPAQCDQATVTVTVNAVNDPPVVDNDSNTIAEDGGSATGDLTDTGDSDPDVTTLTVNTTPVDGPNNGSISINADGTYSYTPNAGFNGQDTIVFSVCDNGTPLPAICVNDTLIITVTPINDAPNAVDDNATTNEDTAVLIDVTSNDTDTDGSINDASVTIVTNPTNGTVTVNPTTGEVTYTPNAGFNGTDSFTYSVCDNGTPLPAQCDQATVTVTVNAVNDPPVVDNDANTIAEDGGSATGDLTDTGDSDPDGTTLTVNTTHVDGPNNGTITINSDGTYSYTPNAGFNGQDTIVVSVCDSGTPLPEICVNDTLIITVTPVNDAPNATLDVASTYENISVTVIVVSNDTDTDGNIDESSLTLVDQPTNGSATVNATTGEITYTPNNGFTGIDTLIYQICDDGSPLPSACDTAMVVITVLPCVTDLTADCDGDGVTNGDEIDPNGDGTPGPNGTNPSDPCSFDLTNQSVVPSQAWLNADCDGDGVTNSDEIDPDGDGSPGPNGTDPNNPCSLILSAQTVTPSQQWLIADCDGDGVTNGEEVDPDGDGTPGPNGTNPIDPCSYSSIDQDLTSANQSWLDADCDGDGVTNGEEIDPDGDGTPGPNGTNPNDPCSFNLADQDLATVNQAWLDADCDGDGVTNGEEIDPDGDGIPGPDGTNPTDPCSFNFADQDLVTVSQAWLDVDCDGDGVTNGEEIDPDGDGTPGPNGTNPTDPCSFNFANQDLATVSQAWLDADCDGDGVTNGEEIDPDGDGTPGPNGTNPTDPCSFNFADQDLATVSQAWLDADCDGDGVTNGEEVDPDGDGTLGPNGTNPTDPCSFDAANQDLSTVSQAWLDADCDGDGVSNGDEIDPDGDGTLGPNGTNPSDPCSFNVADQDLAIVGQAWLDVDCDGDGVTNGDEIDPNGDGTIGPNETDPNDPCSFWFADQTVAPSQSWLDADCDGDGLTNGEEVSGGSNPLDPCDPNTCDSDITIPQAFTPDGDNTNETFLITGIENYPKNKLIVFNRWGNEVYYEEGYNNTWDGTPNRGIIIGNDKLPTSTYYYILDVNGDGESIYKGYVYLKR
jgi:gliding motility-associated-like protein